jgi:hypothetical protein
VNIIYFQLFNIDELKLILFLQNLTVVLVSSI